jgi:hypothetical protein
MKFHSNFQDENEVRSELGLRAEPLECGLRYRWRTLSADADEASASKAKAMLPSGSCATIILEPTIVASNIPVPSASV